ncbi:MAG: pectate lyase [Prolixibacteraceae bacterium]
MHKTNIILKPVQALLFLVILAGSLYAQDQPAVKTYKPIDLREFSDSRNHWYGIRDKGNIVNPVANQPKYPESDIIKIADNMLLYQRDNGGWPKNYDMQAILTPQQIDSLVKTKEMVHTTFDNQTTYTHIEYLAQVYTQTAIEKYKLATLKGIQFMLKAQYPNGGWPQYFPLEENNYSRHITYNDGAFLGVMETLGKVNDNNPMFSFLDRKLRKQIKSAFDKGLECILKTQIVSKGRLTAWCQQHDEVTLQPAWARAYEMPSICNGESVSIVLFLMRFDHPNARIVQSVQSAIKWFSESKIYNTRVKSIQAPPEESQWRTNTTDRIVVIDSMAPPIWTRFYELETERPLFSDRNSKMLYSLAEVGRERRSGYGWYTYAPKEALDKYPEWQKKWAPDKNVLEK